MVFVVIKVLQESEASTFHCTKIDKVFLDSRQGVRQDFSPDAIIQPILHTSQGKPVSGLNVCLNARKKKQS